MARASARRVHGARFCALFVVLGAQGAAAALCPVPTNPHPTLDAAVRDVACTTIQLAAGTYSENVVVTRDVAIEGAGSGLSKLAGALEVSSAASDITLARLSIDGTSSGVAGCWPSLLRTTGGARMTVGDDVAVSNSGIPNGPCRLFADGFESAGTLAWSNRAP